MAESQQSSGATGQTGTTRATGQDAARLRARFDWLNRFSDDELRHICFCEEGSQLEADDEYFDVNRPEQGVIRLRGGSRTPEGSCLVARSKVSPTIWSKLIAEP